MANMATTVDDGFEMPSYNIRHSIATKVAAKKSAKGYILTDEACDLCEMPLMTSNGKTECKVCPAIKKWTERKDEAHGADDAREAAETVEEDLEIRDNAPADLTDCDGKPAEALQAAGGEVLSDDLKAADIDFRSELKDADIHENPNLKAVDRDEKCVFKAPHSNGRYGLQAAEVYGKFECEDSDGEYELKMAVSNHSSSSNDEEGDESDDEDGRYLSKADSEESDDTDAIRARARQIIMEARGQGGWGSATSNDEESIKSPQMSWDDKKATFSFESMEDSCIQERAGEIISQARKDLRVEGGLEGYPEEISSPHFETSNDMYSESLEEVLKPGAGSWEVVVIQSVARRFLAKKLILGLRLKESEECKTKDDEIVQETVVHSNSEHFEPLGVNSPTTDDDDGEGQMDATKSLTVHEEHNKEILGDVQKQQNAAEFEAECLARDNASPESFNQEDTQRDPQDVADPDGMQDTTEQSPPEKHTICHTDSQGPALISDEPSQHDSDMIDSEVTMHDYATVLQQKQVEVAASPANAVAPRRGLFAQLACKFDDAVTDAIGKVHSIVTCSMGGEPGVITEGRFADAFEAEQADFKSDIVALSSSGQVKYDPQAGFTGQIQPGLRSSAPSQDKYDAQVMHLTTNGWREDGKITCVARDVENEVAPTIAPQVHPHYKAPPRPEHSNVRSERIINQAPACPEAHNVPIHQPESQHHNTKENVSGQQPVMNCSPLLPESVVHHPTVNNFNNVSNQQQGISRVPSRQESVVHQPSAAHFNHSAPKDMYSIEMNRRLQMGWVVTNHGCPYCKLQLMRKPNDLADHCLACGPIFTQSSNSIATPVVPAFSTYTPVGSMGNVHQSINGIHNANPLSDVTAAHYGVAADPSKLTMEAPTTMPANRDGIHAGPSSNAPPPQGHPTQKYKLLEPCVPSSTNQIQLLQNANMHLDGQLQMIKMAPMNDWVHDDDAKENAGGANVTKQLQDAKPIPTNRDHSHPCISSNALPPQGPPIQNYNPPDSCASIKTNQFQLLQNANMHLDSQMQIIKMAPRNDWAHFDDAKENAGGANVAKQLQDAKLRIEDAKKFIMSRSTHRMTHSVTPLSNMPMNNIPPPGTQFFKPQMSMMTPTSVQVSTHPGSGPGVQTGIFRPNMSMMTTPGAQRAPTPEMRAMGSLMSPGSDTNANISEKMGNANAPCQKTNTQDNLPCPAPGTESDGYLTPKMPGRYFFA